MKKGFWILVIAGLFMTSAALCVAQQVADDIQKHPVCSYCNMDRQQYAHSRFLVEYDDGTAFGGCSLHCAAVDMALHTDKTPKTFQVGDYATKKLINAETAAWVIGGKKPGVMTMRAKWAFEKKDDAEKFVTENGGAVGDFDQAMKASFEDMYSDTQKIREKRKVKKAQPAP